MTRLDWLPKQPWWETWWIPGIQSSLIIFCHCLCSHISMAINSRHQKLYICISLVAHRSVTENGLKRQGTRLLEINRVPLTSNIIPLTIFLCLILHIPKHTLHISLCDQHTWLFVTIFFKWEAWKIHSFPKCESWAERQLRSGVRSASSDLTGNQLLWHWDHSGSGGGEVRTDLLLVFRL